jgi:hypothetical protein
MKKLVIIFFCSFALNTMAQKDSGFYWVKKGNNTFHRDLKTLQSYFTKKVTVDQFEKTLGEYEKYDFDRPDDTTFYDTTYQYYDGIPWRARRGFDIDRSKERSYNPVFESTIFVWYGRGGIINAIQFSLVDEKLTDDKTGNFINQLLRMGYQYDKPYMRLRRIVFQGLDTKVFLRNKANKISVSLYFADEMETTVTIGTYVN